jgi:hypothetical protein
MMFFSKKPEPKPTMYAEQTCSGCGNRMKRPFEQGDYVFMVGARCAKCNSAATMVTAIYAEYPAEKS